MHRRARIFIFASFILLASLNLGALAGDCPSGACGCDDRAHHDAHSTTHQQLDCISAELRCSFQAPRAPGPPAAASSSKALETTGKPLLFALISSQDIQSYFFPAFSVSRKEKSKPGPHLAVYLQNSSLLC